MALRHFQQRGCCLRVSSAQALLVGRATAPEAQGPIKVPKGKGLLIEFKNPLDTATEFAAQVWL